MDNNKKSKKIFGIIEIIIVSILFVGFIMCLLSELIAPESPLAIWMKDNVWDVKGSLAALNSHVPVLIQCFVYVVIIYVICKLLRLIFKSRIKKDSRAKAVFMLLDGFVKYGGAIAIILMLLKACGVNTTALVASVGVLTLVVGLGAQPLISDIIAGIFIIFENEYMVGEIISVNDFRGTVLEIGIRSTKIQDAAGNIKIINNSAIGDIINLSRDLSLAVVDCDFPYTVPLERIETILSNSMERMKETIPAIVEGPYYKGVCQYKDSNVTVKLMAKCHEEDRFQVERDILREYRVLLVENNIDIAFPQVVINYPEKEDKQSKVTKKEKQTAREFFEEQKELSQNLEEQEN